MRGKEREKQKAAGRDVVVRCDEFTVVHDVGGSDVIVKVHDHHITTIDVWTGYRGPRR
jgi:hypothetical protein